MLRCTAWRGDGSHAIAPFEMPEADLLFEFLIVALDAPAQLGEVYQRAEGDVLRSVEASTWSVRPRPLATRSTAILPADCR